MYILSMTAEASARRVRLTATGGPEVLRVEPMPVPAPGPGQILITTEAAGVAFHDVTTRQGLTPGTLPEVQGIPVTGGNSGSILGLEENQADVPDVSPHSSISSSP